VPRSDEGLTDFDARHRSLFVTTLDPQFRRQQLMPDRHAFERVRTSYVFNPTDEEHGILRQRAE